MLFRAVMVMVVVVHIRARLFYIQLLPPWQGSVRLDGQHCSSSKLAATCRWKIAPSGNDAKVSRPSRPAGRGCLCSWRQLGAALPDARPVLL